MFAKLRSVFSLFTYTPYMLQFQYNTEYGPFLKNNPQQTSEPFYAFLEKEIKKYTTKKSRVLDAGCGLGRLVIDIANNGVAEVIGIDTNRQFLFEATAIAQNHRNNILHYPCHGSYQFRHGDIQHLDFTDNSFSLALCINVIDRIKDPSKAVSELHRILKPKGILFLCDPYDWYDEATPKTSRVDDMKQLLDPRHWAILAEYDPVPFDIYINPRRKTSYQNHLLVLQKK